MDLTKEENHFLQEMFQKVIKALSDKLNDLGYDTPEKVGYDKWDNNNTTKELASYLGEIYCNSQMYLQHLNNFLNFDVKVSSAEKIDQLQDIVHGMHVWDGGELGEVKQNILHFNPHFCELYGFIVHLLRTLEKGSHISKRYLREPLFAVKLNMTSKELKNNLKLKFQELGYNDTKGISIITTEIPRIATCCSNYAKILTRFINSSSSDIWVLNRLNLVLLELVGHIIRIEKAWWRNFYQFIFNL